VNLLNELQINQNKMDQIQNFTMAAMNGLLQNPNYAGMPGHLIAKRAYEVGKATMEYTQLQCDVNAEKETSDFKESEVPNGC
jgi:hypothetical protein